MKYVRWQYHATRYIIDRRLLSCIKCKAARCISALDSAMTLDGVRIWRGLQQRKLDSSAVSY